ncbi:methionine aminopeptidase, type II [Pseudoloma neurophilia]|uniref:Methionine aminopeptidase, type II n=1 Tax=Pseudoloma neurophilia TaxID=146866 RepID=A0A0R0LWJ0_9MICR|nr:methionine aminopeptidase, type II [Pseudoloma neurophilia]
MSKTPEIFKIRDLSIDDVPIEKIEQKNQTYNDCDAEWWEKIDQILEKTEFLPLDKIYTSTDAISSDRVRHHGDNLNHARRAAEAHRRIRKELMDLQPGTPYNFICTLVQQMTTKMLKGEKNDGLGFPTGISVNDCAAHYSSNLKVADKKDDQIKKETQSTLIRQSVFSSKVNDEVIKSSDVIKIDYGCHSNGNIIDSAFTLIWDDKFRPILNASKEATNKAINYLGVDCLVSEIGREISEVIGSYEMEIDGQMLPIQAVKNLNGHSIAPYIIHAGISIPNIYDEYNNQRLKSDTFYALETFATTGNGIVRDGPNSTHFMLGKRNTLPADPFNKKILETIKEKIGTLPFSQRFVKRILLNEKIVTIESDEKNSNIYKTTENIENDKKQKKAKNKNNFNFADHLSFNKALITALSSLTALKILDGYPPLYDNPRSTVSQFEHTIWLDEHGKEIVSKGMDY